MCLNTLLLAIFVTLWVEASYQAIFYLKLSLVTGSAQHSQYTPAKVESLAAFFAGLESYR